MEAKHSAIQPFQKKLKHKKHQKKVRFQFDHPLSGAKHRSLTFVTAVRNFVRSLGFTCSTKECLTRLKTTDPARFKFAKAFFRDLVKDVFGTWEPVHVFHRVSAAALTGSTGILNSVVAITNQDCALYDEFEAIFDEVQPVGPFKVTFRSLITNTAHEFAVGVIDYDNATALASVEGALSYDTSKIFLLNPYSNPVADVHWEGHIQGQPDKAWTDVSASNAYAYYKVYNYHGITGSTTYGVIDYQLPLRFRQVGSGV